MAIDGMVKTNMFGIYIHHPEWYVTINDFFGVVRDPTTGGLIVRSALGGRGTLYGNDCTLTYGLTCAIVIRQANFEIARQCPCALFDCLSWDCEAPRILISSSEHSRIAICGGG